MTEYEEEYTLKEAAEKVGVEYDRLRKAATQHRLVTRKKGHIHLVTISEVHRFLRRQTPDTPERGAPTMSKAVVFAVSTAKGGVGKTTTTLNLGAALAETGRRILLVDFDSQGNLTLNAGIDAISLKYTVTEAMRQYLTTYMPKIEPAILRTPFGFDIVPSNIRLAAMHAELLGKSRNEYVLSKLLTTVKAQYDIIIIDTLTALDILLRNALAAADHIIIPHEPEPNSAEAVRLMLREIGEIRMSEVNPQLTIAGILLAQVDERLTLHRDAIAATRREFGKNTTVFATTIPKRVGFSEAQAMRKPVLVYKPKSDEAESYRKLAQEVMRGM